MGQLSSILLYVLRKYVATCPSFRSFAGYCQRLDSHIAVKDENFTTTSYRAIYLGTYLIFTESGMYAKAVSAVT